MISDQHLHLPASRLGLTFKTHEQVHRRTRLRAPVENVPNDNEGGVSTDPTQFLAKNVGIFQRRYHGVIGAVDICNRHDPINSVIAPLKRPCRLWQNDDQDQN